MTDIFAPLRGPMTPRPWPLAPLLAEVGAPSSRQLALRLGLPPTTVHYAGLHGLTDAQADDWAIEAGLHPSLVWAGWYS